jgi:hypothetical protein
VRAVEANGHEVLIGRHAENGLRRLSGGPFPYFGRPRVGRWRVPERGLLAAWTVPGTAEEVTRVLDATGSVRSNLPFLTTLTLPSCTRYAATAAERLGVRGASAALTPTESLWRAVFAEASGTTRVAVHAAPGWKRLEWPVAALVAFGGIFSRGLSPTAEAMLARHGAPGRIGPRAPRPAPASDPR